MYKYIYNIIFIIINKYINILRYILTIKIIDSTGLIKLIFEKIILKFRVFNKIISNKDFIFKINFN